MEHGKHNAIAFSYDSTMRCAEEGCHKCGHKVRMTCNCGHPYSVHAAPFVSIDGVTSFTCGLCDCTGFKRKR